MRPDQIKPFIKKLHLKEITALLLLLIALYFFRKERHELGSILPAIQRANPYWISLGISVTVIYILLQAGMYVYSFMAVHSKISWLLAIELFLKRNFLSIFLPAGAVTSLAYLPANIRKTKIHKKEVHQASGIYAFTGLFSLFLVGLPVIIYLLVFSKNIKNAVVGFTGLGLVMAVFVIVIHSFKTKGRIHALAVKLFPGAENVIQDIIAFRLSLKYFNLTTFLSVLIECTGMLHLYIAMLAIGMHPSAEAACVGYIVSIILLVSSPFLRGLGAIELSLVYILTLYGYDPAQALEITILYRLFEFWLPLAGGILSFAAKGKNIFFRLAPAALIFLLGIVNIISTLTAPIRERVHVLKEYIPTDLINASNLLVLLMGLLLLVTAAYLVRGLRNAWIIAVVVSLLSLIMHLSKALDWEEATIALLVLIVLLATYKQYRLKSNPALISIGIYTSLALFMAVVIFETIGFYFLEKRHFGSDFTWQQSLQFSFRSILLLNNEKLKPVTRFGREFLFFLNVLSASAWAFFFYTFIRPYIKVHQKTGGLEEARELLNNYGSSAVDYFKVNDDKLIFIADNKDGFISYRIANGFAIVLEEPVCQEKNKIPLLQEFDIQCKRMGLKQAFYRVDEDSMYYFEKLKKNKLIIGQEAVMDIREFKLEGKDRKSLRNGLNSLSKKGFSTILYKAPLAESLVNELKLVSDEWLRVFHKKEAVFSQGMFDATQLKMQDVIVLREENNKAVAFLNIIPDYTPGGFTYDMIRKTADAPGSCMDVLIVALINYGRERNYQWLNLGLVPLSGINEPYSTAERVVKFAYEKIKRFQHYQGLRDFKEKYATQWINKYLVYDNDFDLVQLPSALNKVMTPVTK